MLALLEHDITIRWCFTRSFVPVGATTVAALKLTRLKELPAKLIYIVLKAG